MATTSGRISLLLRKRGSMSIADLAGSLKLSKMAVLKQLTRMESEGKVGRSVVKKSVGRPEYRFSLTSLGTEEFQPQYYEMLGEMVNYFKLHGGSSLVEGFLRKRYEEMRETLYGSITGKTMEAKVSALKRIRDRAGYMAESKKMPGGNFEMTEYRCPIFTIANEFPVACALETGMFSDLLDSEVDAAHRQVQGFSACRFLIRPRANDAVMLHSADAKVSNELE
ncbi:MAG: winged helix-turn-helix transcriptional regulator [Candidatus Thermoplasmatota archaeon]|nr:winged helix-turn-helix transcriptional regulator [Candidatus Thermoplasmatota archaeon]